MSDVPCGSNTITTSAWSFSPSWHARMPACTSEPAMVPAPGFVECPRFREGAGASGGAIAAMSWGFEQGDDSVHANKRLEMWAVC